MRVAENVSPLELADYQKAVRLILRQPLITAVHPDAGALPLVRRWAEQLRTDLHEVLGYRLVTTSDTARLLRIQDELDSTQPAVTAGKSTKRVFDRRRYAYLVLTLAALGRSGTQIALSELADSVAADAGRIDGLGMDTARKADRDAFVDAVAWLEARGAVRTADGSAAAWANDPERAEALYDIDREVATAIYRPNRVLQHLGSVGELLGREGVGGIAQGREDRRRAASRRARRLVLEQPAVYYADADEDLRGQLRAPGLVEDLERLTGLTVERRAEGLALLDSARRFSDLGFPSGGTVAQAALLLGARIAERAARPGTERLPAATAAERRAEAAARLDAAMPDRGLRGALAELAGPVEPPDPAEPRDPAEFADGGGSFPEAAEAPAEAVYPFVTDVWLRRTVRKLAADYGMGLSDALVADPDRLARLAVALLAELRLVAPVDGGVLALPLLARYRGATAVVKTRPTTRPKTKPDPALPILFETPTPEDMTQ
ncbi:TIGR02678 family protein [Streptacidiphilus sp. EB129]|uniref:TIGR02678 family protein n=1 Tax=Streptacidiphilus sp. EB129 TaxID=3156262 RepID=UPI003510F1A6